MAYKKFNSNISKLISEFDSNLNKLITVRGRILTRRKMRNFIFLDLFNGGAKIQLISSEGTDLFPGDLVEISGTCCKSKTNESSIKVDNFKIISRWKAKKGIKTIKYTKIYSPLKAFKFESFNINYIPYLVRKYIKEFLNNEGFLEVQTPILCEKYNGGNSFPVKSNYLNNFLGFNRTTFEEKMQALVGIGFEKIYQIGSIFRSENEYTFLESYSSFTNFNEGKEQVKNLLKYVVDELQKANESFSNKTSIMISNRDWEEVDFFTELNKIIKNESKENQEDWKTVLKILIREKLIIKESPSPETIAEIICGLIAKRYNCLLLINNLPVWSSPLYLEKNNSTLYRTRGFFPDQIGSFEFGMQENNYDNFIKREQSQKKNWDKKFIGNQDLAEVLSGGLPPMFGLGLNPDRISKIFNKDSTIDPFHEK